MPFPITIVEVEMGVGGTGIDFGPRYTRLPGVTVQDGFFRAAVAGIVLG